jgi:hypothetical protein
MTMPLRLLKFIAGDLPAQVTARTPRLLVRAVTWPIAPASTGEPSRETRSMAALTGKPFWLHC